MPLLTYIQHRFQQAWRKKMTALMMAPTTIDAIPNNIAPTLRKKIHRKTPGSPRWLRTATSLRLQTAATRLTGESSTPTTSKKFAVVSLDISFLFKPRSCAHLISSFGSAIPFLQRQWAISFVEVFLLSFSNAMSLSEYILFRKLFNCPFLRMHRISISTKPKYHVVILCVCIEILSNQRALNCLENFFGLLMTTVRWNACWNSKGKHKWLKFACLR